MIATTEWVKKLISKTIGTKFVSGINDIPGVKYIDGVPVGIEDEYRANGLNPLPIYINGSTGSDETGNGSQERPFKTWKFASTKLPTTGSTYINVYIEGTITEGIITFANIPRVALYAVNSPVFEDCLITAQSGTILHWRGDTTFNVPTRWCAVQCYDASTIYFYSGTINIIRTTNGTGIYVYNNSYVKRAADCKMNFTRCTNSAENGSTLSL